MKTIKSKFINILIGCLCLTVFNAHAQSAEAQQLLLNVEKLSQLKNILEDMKKGYSILSNGYNAVRNISQGNFSLHELFLDGLMLVNPEIKKYNRVADIISLQKNIMTQYSSAFRHFKSSDNFSLAEIKYLEKVYKQLLAQSLDNLDELVMTITSNKLRMSDDERLQAIDRIFISTQDMALFLRSFNNEAHLLDLQRKKQRVDVNTVKGYFNLN